MYKIVRKNERQVRKIATTYSAHNFIDKEISPSVSFTVNEARKHFEKETTLYNRIYFVLGGEIILNFAGEKVTLKKHDSCYIGVDTAYEISGTFKAVVVNQPAFGTKI